MMIQNNDGDEAGLKQEIDDLALLIEQSVIEFQQDIDYWDEQFDKRSKCRRKLDEMFADVTAD